MFDENLYLNGKPIDLDESLWVVLKSGEKGYLLANPHTFPGRFNVWLEGREIALTYSLSEISAASDASRFWLKGYLCGNEPGPELFFGADAYELDDYGPEMTAWRRVLREFRTTGELPTDQCQSCNLYQTSSDNPRVCGVCGQSVNGED